MVPIGGGGLIGGIAFAVKQLKPDCRIVGVQAGGRGVHVPVPPRRGPHGAAERVHHCGRHRGEEAG